MIRNAIHQTFSDVLTLPISGGSELVAQARRDVEAVVDLQDLGLSTIRSEEGASARSLRLEDVFGRRLATLNPDARRLLESACIAVDPISYSVAKNAVKLKSGDLTENLRMLSANHLIRSAGGDKEDHFEPYHSRIREIVVSTLSRARCAEVHREIAVALNASGDASNEALAHHWSGAGETNRAAKHARLAGDRAMASTDFEAASAWYRKAVAVATKQVHDSRKCAAPASISGTCTDV